MSQVLFESIARIARHEARARAGAGLGKVTDVFTGDGSPEDHAVSVEMRDSGLVLPRAPIAVGAMGFAAPPAVGDLVLVVFLDGDVNAPLVVGSVYHPDQNPPKVGAGHMMLHLPSGSSEPKLKLDIATDGTLVELQMPGDVKLTLKEDEIVAEVGGAMKLTLSASGGGRAELSAGGSQLTLKKDGDVSIVAKGKLRLEGASVEIEGQSSISVNGKQVSIN